MSDPVMDKMLTSQRLKENDGWELLEQVSQNLKIVEAGDALSRQSSASSLDMLVDIAKGMTEAWDVPPLFIVDYLQRVPAPPEQRIREVRERVGYVAGMLQVRVARELQAPVLALSSLSRASYTVQKGTKEERLGAFKEAGEVEYTAYSALLLYRLADAQQRAHSLAPGVRKAFSPMTLDVIKNREGVVGRVGAKWDPASGTWSDAVSLSDARGDE